MLCFRVTFGDRIGGYYLWSRGSGYGEANRTRESLAALLKQSEGKPSFIPTQDRWLAFLEQGMMPLVDYVPDLALTTRPIFRPAGKAETIESASGDPGELPDVEEVVAEVLAGENLTRWQRYAARKLEAIITSGRGALERYLARHREHYREFFARGNLKPEIALTRGGFSANELAIHAIAELTRGEEANAYVMDGWYFENEFSIDGNFERVEDPAGANILFINSSPNGYVDQALADRYPQRRDELIRKFFGAARKHPDTRYFLVVDKTTDLLYESFHAAEELPPNVSVFETSSLSKHQRGGRNYFFGTVASWGDPACLPALDRQVAKSRAELTPLAIVHLPRLRRNEIEANVKHFETLSREFETAFTEAQRELPPEHRWKVQRNGYCVLLAPPLKALLEILGSGDEVRRAVGERTYSGNSSFTRGLPGQGIIQGDSFGLDEARYIILPISLPEEFSEINNSSIQIGGYGQFFFPRIAFGLTTTAKKARSWGKLFGKKLIEDFPAEMYGSGTASA